ncbi:MAG TPA: thermonuclease family protein [Pseudonocardia sp.]|jgi:endonuclease YncB( thermonuclease family)
MTSDYDVSHELRQLGAFLREGEAVHRLTSGLYGSGAGLLAVTNHRVLLLRDGRGGQASEGFPLERLTTATWSPDGGRAAITVSDSTSTAVLRQVAPADAQAVVDMVWALAGPAAQNAAAQATDYPAEYRGPGFGTNYAAGYGTDYRAGYALPENATTALGATPAGAPPRATPLDSPTQTYGDYGTRYPAAESTGALPGDGFLPGGRTAGGLTGPGQHPDEGSGVTGSGVTGSGITGTVPPGVVPPGTVPPGTVPPNSMPASPMSTGGLPASPMSTGGLPASPVAPGSVSGTGGYRPAEPPPLRPGGDRGPTGGWAGVRGIPEPAGPNTSMTGAVPISVIAAAPMTDGIRVPEQHGPIDRSGPMGTVAPLVGEVPISQLAAEATSSPEAALGTPTVERDRPAETSVADLTTGAPKVDAGSAATSAVFAAPNPPRKRFGTSRTEDGTAAPEASKPGSPEPGTSNEPAALTAEGTERPTPINWRNPKVNPLRGPKAGKGGRHDLTRQDTPGRAEHTRPGTAPAGTGPVGGARFQSRKWVWLGAGATALVALAAIGSVKLITSNGHPAPAPVSPAPAASVASPLGPMATVTKVVGPDRVEVTGAATGLVVVLGIVSPSGSTCGAEDAKKYAIETLSNQTVTLITDPSEPLTDKAGHRLAYLQLPNKTDYSTQAVGAGMAKYFDGGVALQNGAQIKAAESMAKQQKTGLWGTTCNGKFAALASGTEESSATSASSTSSAHPRSSSRSSSSTSDSTSGSTSGSTSSSSTERSRTSGSRNTGTDSDSGPDTGPDSGGDGPN